MIITRALARTSLNPADQTPRYDRQQTANAIFRPPLTHRRCHPHDLRVDRKRLPESDEDVVGIKSLPQNLFSNSLPNLAPISVTDKLKCP